MYTKEDCKDVLVRCGWRVASESDFETSHQCDEYVLPVTLVELVTVLLARAFVADWLEQLHPRDHVVDVFRIRGQDTDKYCNQAPKLGPWWASAKLDVMLPSCAE